jgi:predicted deacylase
METELPVARMITGSPLSIPVLVLHGSAPGPTVWLDAAIHGDELNGVEIIRRVLDLLDPRTLAGTVLAVPVVNIPGFMIGSRYLPDRRDLNRSFPGSSRGSMASRIAQLFTTEIASRCEVGIDIHTGSDHRTNLPQIRADLDDSTTADLAVAFAPPVMIHASTRDGSLRQTAADLGVSVLLYEGGEAWRFDEPSIRIGVDGIMRVLAKLDMVPAEGATRPDRNGAERSNGSGPKLSRRSRWVRARRTGIAHLGVGLGHTVVRGQVMGHIHDTFGHRLSRISASTSGLVVGLNLDPVVNQGDAIVHIAELVERGDKDDTELAERGDKDDTELVERGDKDDTELVERGDKDDTELVGEPGDVRVERVARELPRGGEA